MSDLQCGYAPQTHRTTPFGKIRQNINVTFEGQRPAGQQHRVQRQQQGVERPAQQGRRRGVVLHAQPCANGKLLHRQQIEELPSLRCRQRQVGATLIPQVHPGGRRQGAQAAHRPPQPQTCRPAWLPSKLQLHHRQRAQRGANTQPQAAPLHRQAQGEAQPPKEHQCRHRCRHPPRQHPQPDPAHLVSPFLQMSGLV